MEDTPLRVLRLDGGDREDLGEFQCTAEGCTWTGVAVNQDAALTHVHRVHGGFKPCIVRTREATIAYDRMMDARKVGARRTHMHTYIHDKHI